MKYGKIKLGKYDIDSSTRVDILGVEEFNVIKTEKGMVLISKTPLDLYNSRFWASIYFDETSTIRKIELNNADKKFKINYHTMSYAVLKKLRNENDEFLLNHLGHSYKENISGREYEYSWGSIMSYFDNKSAEAGIVIKYF